MTKKPTVLVDVDGVLADFIGPYLDVIHTLTGRRYTREQVTSWSVTDALGLSDEEHHALGHHVVSTPGFCASLPVLPDARDGIERLRSVAEVYIVTSPWKGRHWAGERLEWLREHFGINERHVVQCRAKHLVHGDVLVDDRTSTVQEWYEARGGVPVLWDTPHNRLDEKPVYMHHTSSWNAVVWLAQSVRS